ncbi:hypothetical protein L249_0241 [Ophiocordyceps polyrhachis-furcata BCC 54312]|uniref:Uncharacterized protein n=1 Tax=Ophiocordyceps polyrhachis-furcata BCC 54312 TaxID=1330021 RepID=A0A367LCK4_9HYPO|nr:hypothetical protein L249_0241 [Ophiocordyceps polyrhachis-furcata BCC 54312]
MCEWRAVIKTTSARLLRTPASNMTAEEAAISESGDSEKVVGSGSEGGETISDFFFFSQRTVRFHEILGPIPEDFSVCHET